MGTYLVKADDRGAYVEELPLYTYLHWIAIFNQKVVAQAYVSYLNSNFTPEQLKGMVK